MPRAVVLGSAHADLVADAPWLPRPGASVIGTGFREGPGGKAGNQAAQLARLGVDTSLLARVGRDARGDMLLAAFRAAGIRTDLVIRDESAATGVSLVVAAQGDYASVIVPGAAGGLSPEDVDAAADEIGSADLLVLQLEVPAAASLRAARIARAAERLVVVNVSPPVTGPSEEVSSLLRCASVLVMNESEAEALSGKRFDAETPAALVGGFGVPCLVVTRGARGALAFEQGERVEHAAFSVNTIDAIGAGDAFLAAFAAFRLEGAPLATCLAHGAAAGALVASREGVLNALADRDEIERLTAAGSPMDSPRTPR